MKKGYQRLVAVPSSYNEISDVGNFVRKVCPQCHIPGAWHKAGQTPYRVIFEPFLCRACNRKLSDHTVYLHLTQDQMNVEHEAAR